MSQRVDTLFVGARVIDPETGLDAVSNVGVEGDRIAYVGGEKPPADEVRKVAGLVLCPGFIDLHSHAQTPSGLRLQALDGVTTALDLEAGAVRTADLRRLHEDEGRPINFGYSAGWLTLRSDVLDGVEDRGPALSIDDMKRPGSRGEEPADEEELARIVQAVESELAQGAIGIGVPIGYAPQAERREYFRMAELAARHDTVVFTHARYASMTEPGSSLEGALEIIAAAAGTGAEMHFCHINSTSLRQIEDVTAAVEKAREQGNRVTTEAYPYGSGTTVISAPFLAPENLPRMGLAPSSLRYLPTGERIESEERLRQLRAEEPTGFCVVDFLPEGDPAAMELLMHSVTFSDTAVASDAVPLVGPGGVRVTDQWPLGPEVVSHPRSAGCFSRILSWVVREQGLLSLTEAIRRCTLLPAQILARAAPVMKRKGRVSVGCEADIVVFDPETVRDRATYQRLLPSQGFEEVMVNGVPVVRGGELRLDVSPGRPVLGGQGPSPSGK